MVIPIGLFFAFHRERLSERILGWVVLLAGIIGIFCSGSRGGWLGAIVSIPVFVAILSIRKLKQSKVSLVPAIAGAAGLILVGCLVALINVSHTFHDMVLGGASEASSTQARYNQWAMGIPYIKSNPITGHGLDVGGGLIGDQIDSYILSLVLETGVPGLVFFVGMLLLPIWYGLRSYLYDMSEYGALAGALACSFIAFTENRLVLSQRENHMLFFSLLAIVIVANYEHARKRVPQRANDKSVRNTYYRAGSILPEGG
jgi:O-antigen ligase